MSMTVQSAKPSVKLIALLGALTAFASLSTDMYLPSLPTIGREFGVTTAATQLTMAVFLVGLAVGQFVYGPLSDRMGRRPLILGGLTLYIAATLMCALAPNIDVMMVGRVLQSLGCSAGVVLASVIVRDIWEPSQTAKVMSGLVLVMGLSPILAPAIGAGILLISGWRTIFWVLMGVTALVLARSFLALPESRSAATAAQAKLEHPFKSCMLVLRNSRLVGYLLVNAAASAMLFAYIAGSPAVFIQVFHFTPQAFSGMLALNSVAIIAGAVVSTTMVTKLGVDRMIATGIVVAIVFGLGLFAVAATGFGGVWGVSIMLFLTMSTFGVMSANCMAGAMSTDPLRTGSIAALMNSAPFATAGVTAWLSGALWDHTPRPMAGVMLGCLVVAAVAMWTLVLGKKQAVVTA